MLFLVGTNTLFVGLGLTTGRRPWENVYLPSRVQVTKSYHTMHLLWFSGYQTIILAVRVRLRYSAQRACVIYLFLSKSFLFCLF